MSVQLGIIGAGTIGRYHVEAASALGIPVGYVVDIDAARGKELASLCGARYDADPQGLWRDRDVTAVVIGTPNALHRDMALTALEAGKDILLEKPMAMNLAQCREINQLATTLGRLVQIGFVHRHTAVGQAALIRFPGELTLDLQIAWAGNFPRGAFPDSQVALLGTQGGLSFELFGDHLLLAREEFGRLTDTRVRLSQVLPYQAQLRDFCTAVETRRVGQATGGDGAQVQAIVDDIYQSSRQRSEVLCSGGD